MTAARPLPSLAQVLFRRARRVAVPLPDGGPRGEALPGVEEALRKEGVVLTRPLFEALQPLSAGQLRALVSEWLGYALAEAGARAQHTSLFKNFPESTPQDTYDFYLRRLLALSLRDPGLPCALDRDNLPFGLSRAPSLRPERACVYGMFDPESFGGCPVCGRVVGPSDAASAQRHGLEKDRERLKYFVALDLDPEPSRTARAEFLRLLARSAPLSPQERDDLSALILALGEAALPLPDEVPQRETRATVLGTLLRLPQTRAAALEALSGLDTATDLLRVLDVFGGGDASLTGPNIFPRLPRPLRRAILARLNALDPRNLLEDVQRYPARWKKAAEALHPFEYAERYPRAALAFAVLRRTVPQEDALGEVMRAGLLPGLEWRAKPPHLRFYGWGGRVERALAARDVPALLGLLAQRPGKLGRRADHLLRLAGQEALPTLLEALPRIKAPTLLLLRAHLSARSRPWPLRLVFPKASWQAYAFPDARPPLPPSLTGPVIEAMGRELLRRAAAARLPHFPLAVLDERLRDLPIPFATRNAARALLTLGRGARIALPQGQFARLFVHWMEYEGQRVDLDLSAAFYDEGWQKLGHCDFTRLRFAETGAVHSGDFTSAPAPQGASEFMDLDLGVLKAAGVRYAVMTVMSYNGIPFEQMAEAFAGYMLLGRAGILFEPRAVEQRFDLRGEQQVSVPLALDLREGVMHWLDAAPKVRLGGVGNQVAGYASGQDALALSARAVVEVSALRARPTLWDVAYLHAQARAAAVWRRGEGGRLRDERGETQPSVSQAALGAFLFRDLTLPAGSLSVALREQVSDGAAHANFEDLLAALDTPEG